MMSEKSYDSGVTRVAERRMTLRFEEEEFDALNDKRHQARTSFQAIGRALFLDWLNGGRAVVPKEDDDSSRETPWQSRPDFATIEVPIEILDQVQIFIHIHRTRPEASASPAHKEAFEAIKTSLDGLMKGAQWLIDSARKRGK